MEHENKTKKQLISELVEMRQRITELEASEAQRKRVKEALRESEKKILDLKEEIAARKLIEKAKGILIDRHKISEKEAMRRLQRESRRQRKKVKEIARVVISSGLSLN